MTAARVRTPTKLSEAFALPLVDFLMSCVEEGEDAEGAQEVIGRIMVVLKEQHVSTTKRLAHSAVR